MEERLDMQSPNWVNKNSQFIAERFPNCVTETAEGIKVDFELLKQELSSDIIEGNKERYRLEWPGKREAIVTANLPTTKTLRPVREDSVDFDNTENIYIEGDNLEVLKLLQESYLGKVKMIYIDPPYNTGKDFVYKDNFSKDSKEELLESGQKDEYNQRLVVNPENAGRYHSDWLSMMYPRLKLARNLLTNDGAILINMDEHEIINLSKLLDEVYGESNNLGTIIWDKRNPKGDAKGIASQHEYITVFAKDREYFTDKIELLKPKKNAEAIINKASIIFKQYKTGLSLQVINKEFGKWINSQKEFSGGEKAYKKIDINGKVYRGVSMAWPNKKKATDDYFIPLIHPKTKKECPIPERGWRNPSSTMKKLLSEGLVLFGDDESKQPERKYLLEDNMYENLSSLLYFGGSDTGLLDELDIPFDTPKVVSVCKEHIKSFTNKNDIILDFFSGSATTAHAAIELNSEDNGNRKFIHVQLPEDTNKKSEAYIAGYKKITDIGKDRIRRAAKKIKKETEAHIDYGFRVYRLDESNMQDVYYKPQEYLQDSMDLFADNVKADRTADDLLAQVMLDWGLPLSLKIEQSTISDKKVFKVAGSSLYACFDTNIDETFIKKIAKEEPLRIVFKDSGFKNDTAKVNVKQLLKQLSPETEMKVI
jgi:adenine-specific DNA-methyltransferase